MKFSHLHVHTQYSLLDGAASIKGLYKKAIKDEMPALAISDHGNMFGVFNFVAEAYKNKDENGKVKVKPIIGCEFYITADRHQKTLQKNKKIPAIIKFCWPKMKRAIAILSNLLRSGILKVCTVSIRELIRN
jgi:DNA polymerase-3 subunit alpha